MKIYIVALAVVIAVVQSGCVVGRRTLELPVPSLGAPIASKGNLNVSSVTDNRAFQNKPSDPSTPSIDGDVTTMSTGDRATMIGRQRGGYGNAMGDIALPAGDTVIQRTKLLIEEGLKHRGYTITSDASAENSASVSIDQFWAWFTPGMFRVTFEARVYCTVTLSKGANTSAPIVVQGYGINHGQVAKNANWQQAYDAAFQDFLTKFDAELNKTAF